MIDIDKIIEAKQKEVASMEEKSEYEKSLEEDKTDESFNEKDRQLTETKQEKNSLMAEIETPVFKPELDKNKTLVEQAEDVVNIMGAKRASEDDKFMNEVSENFQKGVLTEQETNNLKKQRLLEQEYFLKWQDVLRFAFIKSAHGLLFMKIMTIIAMIVYVPLRIVGMIFKSVGTLFDFLNDIFNSIFGGKGKYLRDKDGNVIVDPMTKKPYTEKMGYNLFAKLLFGIIVIGLCLAMVCLFIYMFTGFNVFTALRNLISGI